VLRKKWIQHLKNRAELCVSWTLMGFSQWRAPWNHRPAGTKGLLHRYKTVGLGVLVKLNFLETLWGLECWLVHGRGRGVLRLHPKSARVPHPNASRKGSWHPHPLEEESDLTGPPLSIYLQATNVKVIDRWPLTPAWVRQMQDQVLSRLW
jgi:hypothetical protein